MTATALDHGSSPRPQEEPVVHVRASSGIWLTIEAFPAPELEDDSIVVISPAPAEEIVALRERLYGLSHRERQIADLVIRGFSTRQISDELAIAESTVQGHLTHMFHKLQVDNRRGLLQRLVIDQIYPGAGFKASRPVPPLTDPGMPRHVGTG